MPIYTYRCPAGHEVEQLVRLDESDAPTVCAAPVNPPPFEHPLKPGVFTLPATRPCGELLARVLSTPADSFPGANRW